MKKIIALILCAVFIAGLLAACTTVTVDVSEPESTSSEAPASSSEPASQHTETQTGQTESATEPEPASENEPASTSEPASQPTESQTGQTESVTEPEPASEDVPDPTSEPASQPTEAPTEQTTAEPQNTPETEIRARLSSMTLREKISQMCFVMPEALLGVDGAVTAAGSGMKDAFDAYPVGGVILIGQNLTDYAQPADEEQVWSVWSGNARVKR